jgi:hypothetical protein
MLYNAGLCEFDESYVSSLVYISHGFTLCDEFHVEIYSEYRMPTV